MWTAEERGIFKFVLPNGSERFADPLRVKRELLIASAEKFDDWWNDYINEKTPNFLKMRLEGNIINAVRLAFRVDSLEQSESGIGDEACLDLINSYLAWMEQKKTNSGIAPASSSDSGSRLDEAFLGMMNGSDSSSVKVG